jgi:protein-tyrosine phosphatase
VSHLDQQRLLWEGSYNIRDLGGSSTRDGQTLPWEVLVRADNLGHLTSDGQQALVDYGIQTIIDVRSEAECQMWPHAFSNHATIATINLPLGTAADPAAQSLLDAAANLADWSCLTLQYCQPQIAQLLQQVAQARPGGVLIHCHAGKDRTGLAVALLLALADVPPALIAADYAASDVGLQPLYAQWLAAVADDPVQHAALVLELTAHPETMRTVLTHVDVQYGGISVYLRQCGVCEADQETVRRRLRGEPKSGVHTTM